MKPKLSNDALKRIAKYIKAQPPDPFETMEMDEAHAEFMKGEEQMVLKDPIDLAISSLEGILSGIDSMEVEDFKRELSIVLSDLTSIPRD